MAMPKPKAVSMVGICEKCKESAEVRVSRGDVKRMLKSMKGQNAGVVVVRAGKCCACGTQLKLPLTKNQVKVAWEGLKGDSVFKADVTSETLFEKPQSFRRNRRRLRGRHC